jgi:hypothetical protein
VAFEQESHAVNQTESSRRAAPCPRPSAPPSRAVRFFCLILAGTWLGANPGQATDYTTNVNERSGDGSTKSYTNSDTATDGQFFRLKVRHDWLP